MRKPIDFKQSTKNNADLLLSVYELTARSSLQINSRHQSQSREKKKAPVLIERSDNKLDYSPINKKLPLSHYLNMRKQPSPRDFSILQNFIKIANEAIENNDEKTMRQYKSLRSQLEGFIQRIEGHENFDTILSNLEKYKIDNEQLKQKVQQYSNQIINDKNTSQDLEQQLLKLEKKAESRKVCIKKLYSILEKNEKELELYRTGKKSAKTSFETKKDQLKELLSNEHSLVENLNKKEIERLQCQILNYQAAEKQFQQDISALEDQLQGQKDLLILNEDKLKTSEQLCQFRQNLINQQSEDLLHQKNSHQVWIKQITKEKDLIQDKLMSLEKELISQRAEMKQVNDIQKTNIVELQTQKTMQQQEMEELQIKSESLIITNTQLENELEVQKLQLLDSLNQIENLKTIIEQKQTHFNLYQKEIKQEQSNQLKVSSEQIQELKKIIEGKNSQIDVLKAEVKDLNTQNQSEKQSFINLQEQLKANEQLVMEKEQRIKNLSAKSQEDEVNMQEMRINVEQLQSENEDLNAKLLEQQQLFQSIESDFDQLKVELIDKEHYLQNLQVLQDNREHEFKTYQAEVENDRQCLQNELNRQIQLSALKSHEDQNNISELQKQIIELKQQNNSEVNAFMRTTKELQDCSNNLIESNHKFENLTLLYNQQSNLLLQSEAKNKILQHEIESLTTKNEQKIVNENQLAEQLNSSKSQLFEEQIKLEHLQQQFELKQLEFADYKQSIEAQNIILVKDVESEKAKFWTIIQQYQEQIKQFIEENENLKNSNQKQQQSMVNLQTQLSEQIQLVKDQQALQELEAQNTILIKDLESQNANFKTILQQHKEEIKQLIEKNENLYKSNQIQQQSIVNLQNQLSEGIRQLKNQQQLLQENSILIDQYKLNIEQQEELLLAKCSQLKDLEFKLQSKENQQNQLLEELKLSNVELNNTQDQLKQLRSAYETEVHDFQLFKQQSQQQQIYLESDMTIQLHKLQQNTAALNNQILSLQSEISQLKDSLINEQINSSSLKQELSNYKTYITDKESSLQNLTKMYEQKASLFEECQNKIKHLQEEIQNMEVLHQNKQKSDLQLNDEFSQIQDQLVKKDQDLQNAIQKYKKYVEECQNLKNQLETLKNQENQLQQSKQDFEELKRKDDLEIKQLGIQISDMRRQIEDEKASQQELRQELQNYKTYVKDKENSLDNLTKSHEKQTYHIQELNLKIEQLHIQSNEQEQSAVQQESIKVQLEEQLGECKDKLNQQDMTIQELMIVNELLNKQQVELQDYITKTELNKEQYEEAITLLKEQISILNTDKEIQQQQFNEEIQQLRSVLEEKDKQQEAVKKLSDQQEGKSSEAYVQSLESLMQELLYNRVNLTIQSLKSALSEQQRQQLNDYRKKIGEIQNKILQSEKNQKAMDEHKFNMQQYQQLIDKSEQKAMFYEQECKKKDQLLQEVQRQPQYSNIEIDEQEEPSSLNFLDFTMHQEVLYGNHSYFDDISRIDDQIEVIDLHHFCKQNIVLNSLMQNQLMEQIITWRERALMALEDTKV